MSNSLSGAALAHGTRAAGGVMAGVSAAVGGLRMALSNQDVRRTYVRLLVALFVTSVVLAIALVGTLWWLVPIPADATWWAAIGLWALRVAGSFILSLAAPVLALFVVNLVFPLFGEQVFFAGMRVIDPARAHGLEQKDGMPIARALWMTVSRLVYFIGGTIVAFLVTLIPVLGAVAGPALQIVITSRVMTWELLDPLFDKRHMYLADQRVFIKQRQAAIVGFGLPYTFLLSVPVIGPLFFGLAQAAVAKLVVDVLEPGGDPSLHADAPAALPG